jgi:hypothetical protein
MITKKPQKNPNFICDDCHFITSNKKDFIRHTLTLKHQNRNNRNEKTPKNPFYPCACGKEYKYPSGLSNHKKTCSEIQIQKTQNHQAEQDISSNMILEIVKQNHDFQQMVKDQNKLIIEQNQKIIELSSIKTNNNCNNNSNNTTNSNNKFNLNFFLNEQCKDALNITDFVNSLQLQLTDLENTGKLGFAEGISQIFIRGLKELDVYKRPIHCSDLKRETMYVKDHNIWEKENSEKEKIKKTINKIAHKNVKQIPSWIENHPRCTESTSKHNDLYLNILNESMGGENEDETNKYYEKIVKKVSREVAI